MKCAQGYDPVLKECFEGQSITEFQQTQVANLRATQLSLNINKSYFLVTTKFSINQ